VTVGYCDAVVADWRAGRGGGELGVLHRRVGARILEIGEKHGALAVLVDTCIYVYVGVAGDRLRGCPRRAGDSP
jgi:hypothetical protein